MRFVLALLLTCCVSVVAPVTAQDFSIEKVREIPLDFGDEIVGEIADIARDSEGNYYLPDRRLHTIWVTDPKGNLISRIGQEGSGPGELSWPRSVSVSEDRIVILDVGNNRIAVFSNSGGYLDSFRTGLDRPTNLVSHNDGRIAVGSLMGESLLTVYDADGNKISEGGSRTWPPDPPIPVAFGGAFQHISLTPDGQILYSRIKSYQVHEMGWDGSVRVTYAAEPQGYHPMVIKSIENMEEDSKKWSSLLCPVVIGNHVVVQRQKHGDVEVGNRHIDIFTRDGEVVQMDIESPFDFWYAADDELFAIDTAPVEDGELNPYIVVYRLTDGQEP